MKYKVGDKVRVKSGFFVHELYDGKQFEIKKCDNSDCTYLCKDIDVGYSAWFTEEALELVYQDGGFCNGFRGGKKPAYADGGLVSIHDVATHELWTTPFIISKDKLDTLVDAWVKLGCTTFNLVPDEVKEVIKKTEEKKMPVKFTFKTKEGYRIDKTNNTKIPTITTIVEDTKYSNSATATCDKVDYDERQGVLEALAQLCCKGSFDKEYKKAIKVNKIENEIKRTCSYCGQIFDTPEERKAHEDWHIERRKARHERYLLRKRAKEIAFEEAAQKMAKEIAKENK